MAVSGFIFRDYFILIQWKLVKVNTSGRKNVLTLSEVDLIHIQRHIVKYSQVFNLVSRYIVTVSRRLSIRAVSPVSAGLLFCRPT